MKERSEVLTNSSDWFWFLFSSATIGFFALPIHELGHILGYRLQGIPATMSYARESLPPGQPQTFLGVAGGPLLTLFLCCVALVLIYRNKWLLTAFPLAVIMSLDRIILYGIAWRQLLVLHRAPGMDETKMAGLLGWNPFSWYVAFTLFFILAWVLIALRLRFGVAKNTLLCVIPAILFVVLAALGVFVVERNLFPEQFRIQFG
jgi:glucan phosphoethanolaminetransferase (alkaline phosphatase superfamily)